MLIVRALLPAFVLTFLIAAILAAAGASGGALAIQQAPLLDHYFYWSWPLFAAFTGIGWAILIMMK